MCITWWFIFSIKYKDLYQSAKILKVHVNAQQSFRFQQRKEHHTCTRQILINREVKHWTCTSTCNSGNTLIYCVLHHNFCIPLNSTSCTKCTESKVHQGEYLYHFSKEMQTLCISKVVLSKADNKLRMTVLLVSSIRIIS